MWQSVFRCFDLPLFLEDFFSFTRMTRVKRNTHVEPPPHFSMTRFGPTMGPSWAILPDVRGANYRQKWVADQNPSLSFPTFRVRASTIPSAEEPLQSPHLPPPPKADTNNKSDQAADVARSWNITQGSRIPLGIINAVFFLLQAQNRRECSKISMVEIIDGATNPAGFPQQMLKLREAKVLVFSKA